VTPSKENATCTSMTLPLIKDLFGQTSRSVQGESCGLLFLVGSLRPKKIVGGWGRSSSNLTRRTHVPTRLASREEGRGHTVGSPFVRLHIDISWASAVSAKTS